MKIELFFYALIRPAAAGHLLSTQPACRGEALAPVLRSSTATKGEKTGCPSLMREET
ncbi:MAG: hypothetical protein H8E11_02080 [Candidatus Cloacimonetes bacterium]|nr:hypothetical protein [Candidatus Cloacimonadota bacterium]